MTTKYIKIALFAVLTVAALIASPIAIHAQTEPVKITRHIGEDEFKNTVEQIHMMRAEQTRLNEQMQIEEVDNSAKIANLDTAIEKLMPILDKHQEQTFAKYYIEPARKQYLEGVESDLRSNVYDALINKVDYFGVNLDEKDKVIEIVLSDQNEVKTIQALLQNQPTDVEFRITVDQYQDAACANTTDDCDPIVGGIEIEGICSIGLPVRTGFWPFYSYHFVTAGHCISDNADMNQPDSGSPKIAGSTDSRYESTCDCAISDKTTSTTSNSKVWRSSNNYLTITSESTSRPSTGTNVAVFGKITGFAQGEVTNPNHTFYYNGVNWDLVKIDYQISEGDSGGAVTNASGNQIFGILKGFGTGYSDYSPWDQVEAKFGGLQLH
jgi:hypothetical protein